MKKQTNKQTKTPKKPKQNPPQFKIGGGSSGFFLPSALNKCWVAEE